MCLSLLGANILGISKGYSTNPSHFKDLNINSSIKHRKLDITNLNKLKKIFIKYQPDYVFHLAAQAIVSKSYDDPIATFNVNTIGTLNVLECLRNVKKCKAVIITSDKSYKNLEIDRGYFETDILGGDDPYSGSKGAAELIINSYIKSFFKDKKVNLAIARAGNVIGGGDWSKDRIIPDCFKSWHKNKRINIRNPKSTRPWQHVLALVHGYLILMGGLISLEPKKYVGTWNFGPKIGETKTVNEVTKEIISVWGSGEIIIDRNQQFNESCLLQLDCTKAKKLLG